MNHFQASMLLLLLYIVNGIFIGMAYLLRNINPNLLITFIITMASILTLIAIQLRRKRSSTQMLVSEQPIVSTNPSSKFTTFVTIDNLENLSADEPLKISGR